MEEKTEDKDIKNEAKKKAVPKSKTSTKKNNKKTWKDEFYTVTPLSKLIALGVFITLPFIAFMLGTVIEKWMGHESEVNVTSMAISSEKTEKIIKTEPIIVSTLKYTNKFSDYEFEYPVEWGAISLRLEEIQFTEDDYEDTVFSEIDLDTIQTSTWFINFENKPCSLKVDECWTSVQISDFSEEKYNSLKCFEGECWTVDLYEDKEKVEENGTLLGNNQKWACENGSFSPNMTTGSVCKTYIGNKLIIVSSGYFVENFEEASENCSSDMVERECFMEYVSDSDDYKEFLFGNDLLINTFKTI